MSGIAGIFQRNYAPVDSGDLAILKARLARRGPDAAGQWQAGPAGLVHTMLWSTPESLGERQPLAARCGNLVISADARLDNRADLLPQLDFAGRPSTEISDSQVILAAYEKWGLDCPARLVGDFAFAIWDASRGALFCARDCFGVRPFYYYLDRERFVFASEIKALFALPDIPREMNALAVSDYMLEMFDDKACTFYAHIHRLPPASYLLVSADSFEIKTYWELDGQREIRLKDSREYAEAYRDLFVEAVRARVRSAFPVGSTLSGGLDSSSIACVAGKLLAQQGQRLDTFSAVFEAVPESDERRFMQIVLDQGHYHPHFVRGDLASPLGYLDTLLAEQDQPFYAPHLFMNYQLWKAASEQGVRVFLEGLFGDNVVSHGFTWLNELARGWRWWELYRQISRLARNHPDPAPLPSLMARYIWQDGIKGRIPRGVRAAYRRLRGRPASPSPALPAILDPDYARQVGLEQRLGAAAEQEERAVTARAVHYLELASGLIPTALEIYSSGSATFSLDVRFTYLDRRLAEFCLATPAGQKLDNGYSRMIVRRALEGYLPDEIRWRPGKGDVSHNLIYLLKNEQATLLDLLSSSRSLLQGYLNLPVLDKWAQRVATGQGSENQVLSVYLSAILARWLSSRDGVQNGAEGGGFLPRTTINV